MRARAGVMVRLRLFSQRKVSPLHEVAYRGFPNLVQLLITNGAAVNCTDKVILRDPHNIDYVCLTNM
jgi:hypothetical protein